MPDDRRTAEEPPRPEALREYALLADGRRGALLSACGEIVWLCAPSWDSGAVLADLIGGPGHYTIRPKDRFVGGGHYEEGTLIWRSRWITVEGIIECREALAFPGDPDRLVLLRRIEPVDGAAEVRVRLEPVAEFGHEPLRDLRQENGIWTARCGGLRVRWSGAGDAVRARRNDRTVGLVLDLEVPEGGHHDLVLEISDGPLDEAVDPDRAWSATEESWRRASVSLPEDTLALRDARQAYTVLRGMTSPDGGTVAAATTSLPERAEAGRNYDYRYVWIRDQCYVGLAAAAAGGWELFDTAVRFIGDRLLEHGADMAPAYTCEGRPVPDQRILGLPGYPGGRDRVGNWVNHQFQLDAFGEALILLATAQRHGRLSEDGRRAVDVAVRVIAEHHRDPDAGIWETDDRLWTHSRLICAAGLYAVARAAPSPGDVVGWTRLADLLVAEASESSLHPSGRWQRSPEDPGSDVSLLLPALRGALAPDDPRTVRTLEGILTELAEDHFAYRFRHDDRPLREAEGAFLLCGFLVALSQHQRGNREEALRWFERNRAACGPSGLFTEEYDVEQRRQRGNLPQAFVHALMLECAARLAAPPGEI